MDIDSFVPSIFRIRDDHEFNGLAMKLFHYQNSKNPLYREFCDHLGAVPGSLAVMGDLPYLPIEFFRDHRVVTGPEPREATVFTSSGTTGSVPGKHVVADPELYRMSFRSAFRHFYGDPEQYAFLALLPGYMERPGSSLVYMMEDLVGMTRENGSGFFLDDLEGLSGRIRELKRRGSHRIMLFGVSFALLEMAERYPADMGGHIVMETGGMKGRRREMIREELHEILCGAFHVKAVHSEYGMTELLSQAYSQGGGRFRTPPWMRVLIRDVNDPLTMLPPGQTGGINIIDLANVHSCAFLATQDLGKVHEDGSFEVLGRFDNSDIRGCNLMVS